MICFWAGVRFGSELTLFICDWMADTVGGPDFAVGDGPVPDGAAVESVADLEHPVTAKIDAATIITAARRMNSRMSIFL
jgi:hypothetical protein